MNKNKKLPSIYTPSQNTCHWDRHNEGQKAVKENILKEWEKRGHRGNANHVIDVKIIHMSSIKNGAYEYYYVTRVYVGSYGKKKMLQSKRNEVIEIEKVIKALREYFKQDRKEDKKRDEEMEAYRASLSAKENLEKQFNYGDLYRAGIRINPSHYGLKISLEKSLVTEEQARELIKKLLAL